MTSSAHESTAVQNLGSRTIRGTFWLLLGRGYQQILLLVKVTVLGRLLGPEEFGLLGIALLAVQFMATFTHTGFASALIHQQDLKDSYISTAWWVLLGRGIFIALALFLLSPWIAAIFKEPRAIPVLRAFAGIQFIFAFASIGIVLLSKGMEFNKLFKYEAWSSTVELVAAIIIALWYRNVWALVGGALVGTVVRVVLSYVIYPYFPRLCFDRRSAWELFRFGQWLLLGSIMVFVFTRSTDALSGIMFGAAALGLYQMASRFGMLTTNQIGQLFIGAIFPAYSLIQNDAGKLKNTFLKVLQVSSFILFPITVIMIFTVAPFLPVLLGAKWAGVVSLIPGVALGGLIQAMLRTGSPLFLATGKPRLQFGMDALSASGVLIFIYPFSQYFGLEGLAWSYGAGMGLGLPLWWCFIKKQSKANNKEIAIAILPTILSSAALGVTILIMGRIFLPEQVQGTYFIGHLIFAVLGLLLFLTITLLLERYFPEYKPLNSIVTLIKNNLRKSKQPQMKVVG